MILTKEQQEEFSTLAKPLIKWLNDNANPHAKIIVEYDSAEVVSGYCAFHTEEFVKD